MLQKRNSRKALLEEKKSEDISEYKLKKSHRKLKGKKKSCKMLKKKINVEASHLDKVRLQKE